MGRHALFRPAVPQPCPESGGDAAPNALGRAPTRCFSPDSTPGVSMMEMCSSSGAGHWLPSKRARKPFAGAMQRRAGVGRISVERAVGGGLPDDRVEAAAARGQFTWGSACRCARPLDLSFSRLQDPAAAHRCPPPCPPCKLTCPKLGKPLVGLVRLHRERVAGCAPLLVAVVHHNKAAGGGGSKGWKLLGRHVSRSAQQLAQQGGGPVRRRLAALIKGARHPHRSVVGSGPMWLPG